MKTKIKIWDDLYARQHRNFPIVHFNLVALFVGLVFYHEVPPWSNEIKFIFLFLWVVFALMCLTYYFFQERSIRLWQKERDEGWTKLNNEVIRLVNERSNNTHK